MVSGCYDKLVFRVVCYLFFLMASFASGYSKGVCFFVVLTRLLYIKQCTNNLPRFSDKQDDVKQNYKSCT